VSVPLTLRRDCPALAIPGGKPTLLPAGMPVVVTQALGGSYTVEVPAFGGLFRVAGRDADALGLSPSGGRDAPARSPDGSVAEDDVWDRLRTCYDPEIPVNVVDLGLVYDLKLLPHPSGRRRVEVKMTLTAPGCGMGPAIAADARQKLETLPGVAEADVRIVWDPPWSLDMMSPEAKRRLGIG
jgi:probable FeS assembly SUF system protein SufT